MKLLQMSGCDVSCSLALSQADHTHCSSRQNGGYNGNNERPAKRDLDQFAEKTARSDDGLENACDCVSACGCIFTA